MICRLFAVTIDNDLVSKRLVAAIFSDESLVDKIYTELALQLFEVEKMLREMNHWSHIEPLSDVLASTQPFAVDTLEFVEWLQFIFLPRMHLLVEAAAPLPENCSIAPMAEEYFRGSSHQAVMLIKLLESIDALLSH